MEEALEVLSMMVVLHLEHGRSRSVCGVFYE
jgi:hypothetical protein